MAYGPAAFYNIVILESPRLIHHSKRAFVFCDSEALDAGTLLHSDGEAEAATCSKQ